MRTVTVPVNLDVALDLMDEAELEIRFEASASGVDVAVTRHVGARQERTDPPPLRTCRPARSRRNTAEAVTSASTAAKRSPPRKASPCTRPERTVRNRARAHRRPPASSSAHTATRSSTPRRNAERIDGTHTGRRHRSPQPLVRLHRPTTARKS